LRDRRRGGARCARIQGRARRAGRSRLGRRRAGRWRRRRGAGRQERLGIEVALILFGHPDPEVDVGHGFLGIAAWADRPDTLPLVQVRPSGDRDRAEMGQRHGEPRRGRDRDGVARRRHRPGERDGTAGRSEDRRAAVAGDVNAPVLPRRIRMRRVEGEVLEDRAVGRPRPRGRTGRADERSDERREKNLTHRHHLVV
jgi:hypothetical protein